MTSEANGKPQPKGKRKPWIPPRFEEVGVDLVSAGHPYYDTDDASTPGTAKTNDPEPSGYHPNYDQTNPYNS